MAFIDVEHALDPAYAEALGVDIDNLLVSQPDTGEQAMEICEALVRSGAIDVIVVDSVAALVPRAEIEGEMGDSHVGLQARLMSQAMRKLTGVIGKTNTVVHLHQPAAREGGRHVRQPRGHHRRPRPEVLRLRAHRYPPRGGLKIRRRDHRQPHPRQGRQEQGGPPFREAEFDIMFGEGISKMGELIDLGVKLGIVQKSGAWFNYGDIRLGQGRDNAKQFLRDNPRSPTTSRVKSAPMPISSMPPAARGVNRPLPRSCRRLAKPATGQGAGGQGSHPQQRE